MILEAITTGINPDEIVEFYSTIEIAVEVHFNWLPISYRAGRQLSGTAPEAGAYSPGALVGVKHSTSATTSFTMGTIKSQL